MKGLSLPINVLVIVVVAVIVLLGVVAIYFGGFNPFSSAIGVESAKNDVCGNFVRFRCTGKTNETLVPNFDANKDGVINPASTTFPTTCPGNAGSDNLAYLCVCYYGRTTEASCRQLCGCP
jgi:hypothetical protein